MFFVSSMCTGTVTNIFALCLLSINNVIAREKEGKKMWTLNCYKTSPFADRRKMLKCFKHNFEE